MLSHKSNLLLSWKLTFRFGHLTSFAYRPLKLLASLIMIIFILYVSSLFVHNDMCRMKRNVYSKENKGESLPKRLYLKTRSFSKHAKLEMILDFTFWLSSFIIELLTLLWVCFIFKILGSVSRIGLLRLGALLNVWTVFLV